MAKILVTGGTGFIGKRLCAQLSRMGHDVTGIGSDVDLRNAKTARRFVRWDGPFDSCYHLAGWNGGLALNRANPFRIFHDNTLMALNALEACRLGGVGKFLGVVASCAYPCNRFGELCETDFFEGAPHETVECHGMARRALQLACKFARAEHGYRAVCACPATVFGPGDSLDPVKVKVPGAMARRFVEAVRSGADVVTCWGTGAPKRELIYVDDCVTMLIKAMDVYEDSNVPLNVSSGQELTVRELALLAARAAGYQGEVEWDHSRPDGQMSKKLSLERMRELLGDNAFTPVEEAMRLTVEDVRARTGHSS